MIEKFFTTEQVANILQVHPFTILKFIKQGKLNGIKLGRVYRIMESDVNDFIEAQMIQPKKKRTSKKQTPEINKKTEDSLIKTETQTPDTTVIKEELSVEQDVLSISPQQKESKVNVVMSKDREKEKLYEIMPPNNQSNSEPYYII